MTTHSLPSLGSKVSRLKGVGPRIEEKLNRLGIYTLQDLLFYLPRKYVDRTQLTPIGAVQNGEEVLVQGKIELVQIKYGKRRSLICRISDGSGALDLRFFYFSKTQQEKLQRDSYIRCFGRTRYGINKLEIIHPEYQIIDPEIEPPMEKTLTPVYSTTANLHQNKIRHLTDQVINVFTRTDQKLDELLPGNIPEKVDLMDINSAIKLVHRPPPQIELDKLVSGIHPSQKRLVFEELLAHFLALKKLRMKLKRKSAECINISENKYSAFINKLPFKLTTAQKKAITDIYHDLSQPSPMLRLLQGDVGSGKTIVAALAAMQTVSDGWQVAFMAPTELLAEQHYQNFTHWMNPYNIPVVLLTGKLSTADKQSCMQMVSEARPVIIIGTHALFQKNIDFACLQLIIIDEQHKFGVHQRLSLLDKGTNKSTTPHQLIMTATPIPRTLAMTIYADLDISIIDEIPPGRPPVKTVAISAERRDEVIQRIQTAHKEGRQIYWVCTLIDESETLQCETAINTYQLLAEKLENFKVGLIHGKMKHQEKEKIMSAFKSGNIDLLVSTTVIEVGVDVPNASLMIIENAERLGLFQLHQLRGRVGRGPHKSDCVMLYQPPLNPMAKSRLDVLRTSVDGFEIARKDLELRGPGEFLGTRQTGLPELKIADLIRDARLIPEVQDTADLILDKYPEYTQKLIDRWLSHDVRFVKV